MKNKITKKQKEIIILLYRFRFLNRNQIQKHLRHKKPHRINQWLKSLVDKKIVGKIYSKKIGDNNKPAIYYLATKSKSYLIDQLEKDNKLIKRIYGEPKRSLKFINHCLMSADFYLELKKNYLSKEIFFFTKIDLLNHNYLPDKHPDAYVAIKEKKNIKRYFFEIIDEGTPRFVIRAKIKQYLEYFDSNLWQEVTKHPFPKILILCPNEIIKKYLHSYITKTMEEEYKQEPRFYLSTENSDEWSRALKPPESN